MRSRLQPLFATIVLFLLGLLFYGLEYEERTSPRAVKGVMDLRAWDFSKDGPVDLSGEYAFYWEQHLSPSDFADEKGRSPSGFINVPGYWNGFPLGEKRIGADGYATYHLKVLLQEPKERLALKFLDFGTAFTAFVNGKKVLSVGTAGKDRESTVPRCYSQVVGFSPEASEMNVIFQISNFHHRRAGAWKPIKLGTEKEIRNIRERYVAFDLFLLGSLFIIAIYHLSLFALIKKDRSPLFFGLFGLLVALRLLTTGETYFIHIFPRTSWEILVKLEYLSFYLAIPTFTFFMRSIFKQFSRRFLELVSLSYFVLSGLVLVTPVRVFSHTLPLADLLMIATAAYGAYVLIIASFLKQEGAFVFLLAFVILSVTAINDVLYTEQKIQTGYLAPFGLFIFIFSQAFLLSRRISETLRLVSMQRQELKDTLEAYKQEMTDRIQTTVALRESEEKYRTILQSIEEGYYEVDLSGNMTFFNDSLCEILGYSRDELLGMNNRRYMSENTAKKVYDTLNQVYQTGRPAKAFDWETIRKDGTTRFLEISVSLMRDPAGHPTGFRGIARDITDRKQAEEQARLHEQQLMQASKMVALGTLVSGVAHEVNNPNNFIMLNSPLLKEAWTSAIPILDAYREENGDFLLGGMKYSEIRDKISALFSGVIHGSERIKQIVEDLKHFVREDTGGHLGTVDMNAILQSAISLLSNMIRKATTRFSVQYGTDLPSLRGNAQRLEQVMINVIQNACQALEGREKGISVATSYRKETGHIVVAVRDEGIGIPPESLSRITDPFFTTKQDIGGVGLGLSISTRIIEEHGGSIHFASETGKGTTVEIRLPQSLNLHWKDPQND